MFFNVVEAEFLPASFILVRSKATRAESLKGTRARRSLSLRELMMVLMECLTRSSRVNPFYSSSFPVLLEASVSMEPEMSKTQIIDTGFLLFISCSDGGYTVTLTISSLPSCKASTESPRLSSPSWFHPSFLALISS